jgi:uncharacterized protein (TIGR02147 family)
MQPDETTPASIYAYDDFRKFLKDRYEARKRVDPECSARSFAAAAGLTNPGFLNDVIKGRRSLSREARMKLAAAFRLSDSETEYFDALVDYGQAKKEPLRQELYKKILGRRNRSAFTKINPALSRYYQDFRYSLIYNALMACDFRGDYEQLSEFISPAIPPGVLKTHIEDLCSWGLVIRQQSGRYTVTQRFVEPPSTLMEQVRQLNREWILHAAEALMRLPADKRHMSTMLLSLSPEACRTIGKKIEQFRQELWDVVEQDKEEPSCVMQLNMQYFPRSKAKNREEGKR